MQHQKQFIKEHILKYFNQYSLKTGFEIKIFFINCKGKNKFHLAEIFT